MAFNKGKNIGLDLVGEFISNNSPYFDMNKNLCVDIPTNILNPFIPYLEKIVSSGYFSSIENALIGKVAGEISLKIILKDNITDFEFFPELKYDTGIDFDCIIKKNIDAKVRFNNTSGFTISDKIILGKKPKIADMFFVLSSNVSSKDNYFEILKMGKITFKFEGFITLENLRNNKEKAYFDENKGYYRFPIDILSPPTEFFKILKEYKCKENSETP